MNIYHFQNYSDRARKLKLEIMPRPPGRGRGILVLVTVTVCSNLNAFYATLSSTQHFHQALGTGCGPGDRESDSAWQARPATTDSRATDS